MERVWLDSYTEGVPAEIDPDACPSLVALTDEAIRRFADRPAFESMGVRITFAELDRLAADFAGFLAARGLARGERVALMMPNVLQYPVALLGVLRAGLVVVSTNPLYTARELRHQLADSGARAIVVLENFAHELEECIADTAVEHVVVTALGDMLGAPKSLLVNFVVRHVKRLVPPFRIDGAIRWREALATGRVARIRGAAPGRRSSEAATSPSSSTRAGPPGCRRARCSPTATWSPTSSSRTASCARWPARAKRSS